MTFDGTKINITRLENVNSGVAVSVHDCSAFNGGNGYIDWTERDDKMMVVFRNTSNGNVKLYIAEGNGIAGKNKESDVHYEGPPDDPGAALAVVNVNNIAVDVPAGETCAIALESSRFKWVSGPLKGKVWMYTNAEAGEICAISEP